MKLKELLAKVGAYLLVGIILIILMPVFLIYLIFKLLATPYGYVKHRRSIYPRDFPRKYRILEGPHEDAAPYDAIKTRGLPVEYVKWSEDYFLNGYFIYRDILLVFCEPLFFDKKKGLWLFWPNGDGQNDEEDSDGDTDHENTDDCLSVEGAKEFILEDFHSRVPNRKCNDVVFFYSRKHAEYNYEEGGLEKMRLLPDFIVYETKELGDAIERFVNSH